MRPIIFADDMGARPACDIRLQKRASFLPECTPDIHSDQTMKSSSRRASVLRPRALIPGLVRW